MKRIILLVFLACSSTCFSHAQTIVTDSSYGKNGTVLITCSKMHIGHGTYNTSRLKDGRIVAILSDSSLITTTRFNQNGTTDTTFGVKGAATLQLPANYFITRVIACPDNKTILIGGRKPLRTLISTFEYNFVTPFLIRLKQNGTVDSSFGNAGVDSILYRKQYYSYVTHIAIDSSKNIICVGYKAPSYYFYTIMPFIIRLKGNGAIDTTFKNTLDSTGLPPGSYITEYGHVFITPNNRIVAAGTTNRFLEYFIDRYKNDGTPDSSFGNYGSLYSGISGEIADYRLADLTQTANGDIIMCFNNFLLSPYSGNGLASWDSSGRINKLGYQFGWFRKLDTTDKHKTWGATNPVGAFPLNNKIIMAGYVTVDSGYRSGVGFQAIDTTLKYHSGYYPDTTFGKQSCAVPQLDSTVKGPTYMVYSDNQSVILQGTVAKSGSKNYYTITKFKIVANTSVSEVKALNVPFYIYPNPANNIIYVSSSKSAGYFNISLSDITGRQVWHGENLSGTTKIMTANMPNGIYLCHIIANGEVFTKKVLVTH